RRIVRIDLVWYPSRAEALSAEAEAIRTEGPLWNRAGAAGLSAYSKWVPVVNGIRAEIADGNWPPGARLLSAQEYAKFWPVAASTIRRAIKYLIGTGELRGALGRAVYVAEVARSDG